MANLFFVYTPMQLLVAQQIIHQEQLNDNIMLYGYVEDNIHFLDIYEVTMINAYWNERILMPQVGSWADISSKHLLRDCKYVINNFAFISNIIKKKVDTVYLGEIANHCYHLAAMSFHRIGLKVCFFEEGSSHYINNLGMIPNAGILNRIFAFFIDLVFYRPFFKISFGKMLFVKGIGLDDIPMDIRFSIVPLYHEPFDRLILYKPLFSEKLNDLLKSELIQTDKNRILLLTTPFYINGIDDNEVPYIKTIIDFVKSIDRITTLYIKFHPREKKEVRDEILNKLDFEKTEYVQLGNTYNIPVEYYLQYIHFDKIIMFFCSTYFYNGYLFPKTQFVSLLKDYYDNCKIAGSMSMHTVEPLLNKIPQE